MTLLTDLADLPPRFWIERGQTQHFVCGTAKAVMQARAMGHPDERIHATSGMILRPDFYRACPGDRAAGRRRLGLHPELPTGIVLFGGHGSLAMVTIARQLPHTQLIFACGHNEPLMRRLLSMPAQVPRCVVGYELHFP